jgi:hypothetical protein
MCKNYLIVAIMRYNATCMKNYNNHLTDNSVKKQVFYLKEDRDVIEPEYELIKWFYHYFGTIRPTMALRDLIEFYYFQN